MSRSECAERTGGCWAWPCRVSVVALAACGSQDDEASPKESSAAAEQSPGADSAHDQQGQQGKPNTKDIPEVVAEVNGKKIKKSEFVPLFETQYQQMQMQAQQSGQPVDEKGLKKQTAENLVSTEVLVQEADKRKIDVTDKDIDKGLEGIREVGADEREGLPQGHEGPGHG